MVKRAEAMLVFLGLTLAGVSFAGVQNKDPNDASSDSFARIEALDRNIEQAGKEIDALKVDRQLKDLQDQAKKMSMDFSVMRIYGVDQDLRAMIQFSNKAVLSFKLGDTIENKFKIVEMKPDYVRVYDETSQKSTVVPFL